MEIIYIRPVVALDVTGREFSHLVISRNGLGGLNYVDKSRALNESFAEYLVQQLNFIPIFHLTGQLVKAQ